MTLKIFHDKITKNKEYCLTFKGVLMAEKSLYLNCDLDCEGKETGGVDIPTNQDTIKWLKGILEPMGIGVDFRKGNEYVDTLTFSYNDEELREKRTRNAGRKRTLEYQYTVEQVQNLIAKKGAVGAAKDLKMSKNQMYVRLKQAREREDNYF